MNTVGNYRYVVITPVRNEAQYLQSTIQSMVAQTVRPTEWIIVDDGSNDDTFAIGQAAAREHPWIQIIKRADRGHRQPGGGVVEAFDDGFAAIRSPDWQFIVKLDGDLSFGPDCFERCLRWFEQDSRLGIGGGTICASVNGELVPEAPGDPVFHVRGATKIYRRECWNAIGGRLVRAPGWDTVDEFRANMLGWVTYTFPGINLHHHRAAGGAQGTWRNWVKNGLANYIACYHPLFMIVKCARRSVVPPRGVMSLGLLVGFFAGYLKRVPQAGDRQLIRYVHQQQLRRLFGRESLWDRKAGVGSGQVGI